jgi:hypothetical protein
VCEMDNTAVGGSPQERTRVGLCIDCGHGQLVTSQHGSVFWLCRRSTLDATFARYPRLPVLRCRGYEQEHTNQ